MEVEDHGFSGQRPHQDVPGHAHHLLSGTILLTSDSWGHSTEYSLVHSEAMSPVHAGWKAHA
jgi:hypothetical protein